MFTAIRAETAHSPTYQLLRGELKKRGGRSPGSGNQVIAGWCPLDCTTSERRRPFGVNLSPLPHCCKCTTVACIPATPTGRDAPHVHPELREPACVPLAWEKQGHGRAALAVAAEGT